MKKYRIFFTLLICMMMLCGLMTNVQAARVEPNVIDTAKTMLQRNDIQLNTNWSSQILDDSSAVMHNAYRIEDSGVDTGNHRVYTQFRVTAEDASVTMIYRNYGIHKQTGRVIDVEMTISDLAMSNGNKPYVEGTIGFNKYYPGMILFESSNPPAGSSRGSVAKITLRFLYHDTGEYINVGNFRVGIGGYNSEKLTGADNALGAPQWEWVSFQNAAANVQGWYDSSCLIQKYSSGQTVRAKDNDPGSCDYGWAVGGPYSYDTTSTNPTEREIISNGGSRYPQILEVMTDKPEDNPWVNSANYIRYKERIKMGFWLFSVPTVNYNGKEISQFQFEMGKTFGTVELGIKPIILANSHPGQPAKSVDKTTAHENEELTYTVSQRTGYLQDNAKTEAEFYAADTIEKYDTMVITDELPNEVTFKSGSILITNSLGETLVQNVDYTISGPYTNGNGKQEIAVHFTNNYLKNKMRYLGETYYLNFKAIVKDLTFAQAQGYSNNTYKIFTAPNEAKTIINGTTEKSNKVTTQIIYDILTKGVNAIISDLIAEIEGGSNDNKVVFTPELGYYVDTVEWQTQTERYALTTPELSNVTEIPSINKVRIPEDKNGTENTYKHETTITGENSNLTEGNQQTNITDEEKNKLNYDPFGTTTFTYNNVDNNHYVKVIAQPMKMVIDISKEDAETQKVTQGDAKFVNAVYTVYEAWDGTDYKGLSSPVTTIKLDANGNGSSVELPFNKVDENGPYGEYYVFETTTPEGYLRDFNVYTIKYTAQEQTIAREKVSHHEVISKDPVKKSNLYIIKSLDGVASTDSDPAVGCELYLTLDSSNGSKVYTAVIDEHGYASFNNIPYGWYTITESEEARNKGYKLMDPEPVYIQFDATREENTQNNTQYYRIIEENAIETHVRVVKVDAESNLTIPMANTEYKIWDYQNDRYVEMVIESGRTTTFKTNDDGYFITPQKLRVGKYKLVELDPPYGYHPVDMDFEVEDGIYENVETVPTVTVNQKDIPQKGKIVVNKTAEVMTGVTQTKDETTGKEVLQPVYEKKGLKDVTYTITAVEDIVTGDGIVHMNKGDKVTITTNENGVATTDWLYLGKYTIQETETPSGYVLNSEVKEVTLDYRTEGRDEEGRLVISQDYTVESSYTNDRVKLNLEFAKEYGTTQFNNINSTQKNKVKFGLYAAEDIKSYNGAVAITKNSLLEVISVNNGKAKVSADLPVGKYYIQEIEVSDIPFEIDNEKYGFEFKPDSSKTEETIQINNGKAIINSLVNANPKFLKINSKVYNAHKAEIDKMISDNDLNALEKFAKEFGLEGAEYQVYFKDENNEYQKLQSKSENGDWEDVIFVSDQNGLDDTKELPVGTYYLKEIKAPVNYEVDPNFVEVKVSENAAIAVVHDPKIKGKITVIHKDVDTDEIIYPTETTEDDIDEPYTTVERTDEINESLNLHFDAYELVEEKYPENAEGYYEKEEQIIVYYYKKVMSNVIVKYLDVDTLEEISDGFEYIDYIGENYDTFDKEIPGYELVVEMYPTNADGQYTRDTIEVIYYYRKLPVDTSDINLGVMLGIVAISFIGIVTITRKKSIN